MSQILLDEQIDPEVVLLPIRSWITAQFLRDLRPGERILDHRVPTLLRTLRQPTFVTIDQDFWDRRWRSPHFCILYFDMRSKQQDQIPDLLRALLRLAEFRTRAIRMGKLARVGPTHIDYYEFGPNEPTRLDWHASPRRRRKR